MVKQFTLVLDGNQHEIEWSGERVVVDDRPYVIQFPKAGVVEVEGRPWAVELRNGQAFVEGIAHNWTVQGVEADDVRPATGQTCAEKNGDHGSAQTVDAIMPGKVVDVLVSAGDCIEASQVVLVLEAMKMQNEIQAGFDGVVKEVSVVPGQDVALGTALLVIDPNDGE